MTTKAPVITQPLVLGKLGSSYGVRGWLRIFPATEDQEGIFDYQPLYIRQSGKLQLAQIEEWKWHSQDLVIKLKGIDDRETAQRLTNAEIVVEADALPVLDNGDYYWKDLIGCQVVSQQGYDMGIVSDLMETGSNDVLVVKANFNDAFGIKERLIPFLEEQVIKSVDLEKKHIVVDWDPNF